MVHALTALGRRRPLLTFAVLGALLFVGKWGVEAVASTDALPLETLTVRVPAGATPEQIERATDESVLLSLAIHAGYVRRDTAIVDRLVRNVQFVDASLTPEEALDEALRLDMHRSDPVVRARLIWLATETLVDATREPPSDAELRRYMRDHAARFRRPTTLTFEQIFVSRQRHGEDFDARVRWVGEHLEPAPRVEPDLSDSGLLPTRMTRALPVRIDARFGAGFSERLLALEGEDWSAPMSSVYGVHFVRIIERSPGGLPELEQVRGRLMHDHLHDSRGRRVREALTRMRAGLTIRVEPAT